MRTLFQLLESDLETIDNNIVEMDEAFKGKVSKRSVSKRSRLLIKRALLRIVRGYLHSWTDGIQGGAIGMDEALMVFFIDIESSIHSTIRGFSNDGESDSAKIVRLRALEILYRYLLSVKKWGDDSREKPLSLIILILNETSKK